MHKEKDGFDLLLEQIAQNTQEITIGGATFKVAPASKRINEGAITAALAHFKSPAGMPPAENDGDEYRPEDAADAKTTAQLSKFYGIRLLKMRDHRAFIKASLFVAEFRAIACILNQDGTLYADTPATVAKAFAVLEQYPTTLDLINEAAGWHAFDEAETKKLKKLKKATKIEPVEDGGQDGPNG